MGYAICFGPCIGCNKVFGFNPHRVPSLTYEGTRRPICRDCVTRVNPKRKANGLPPIEPFPDAYEAIDEAEL
jgi:hypothetical protein